MNRVSNNIKFCTFINILRTYSNEEVSISIKEINNHMEKKLGITLDRRTMYSYIRDMREIGIEVSHYDKEKEGYFLKDFFLKEYELELLMDSVKSSKFITKKKTEELLEKISTLNFIFRGRTISSNVFIKDISKNNNEEIYDYLNLINKAITKNKKLTFNYYYRSNASCNKCNENMGIGLKVNPICVVNDQENYYLVSIDDDYKIITYYNMDNMKSVNVLEEEIKDTALIGEYSESIRKFNSKMEITPKDLQEYVRNGGSNGTEY